MLIYPENEKLMTVVAIMPPPNVQRLALPIMSQHHPGILKFYTAHISLFFPFVGFDRLSAACDTMRAVCKDISPFDVTFANYGYWEDGAYLAPTDPTPIQNLFSRLFAHFPDHPPYGGKYGNDLDPHITIARFKDSSEAAQVKLPAFDPITFTVDRINVMYGSLDTPVPMITYDVIKLEG